MSDHRRTTIGIYTNEITLTCDLSKSAIASYAFPGLSERCSICHQLVRYMYPDSHGCNDINNSLSLSSTEGIDFKPDVGGTSSDTSAFSVMKREYLLDGQSAFSRPYTPYYMKIIQPTVDWRHWQHEPNFESESWDEPWFRVPAPAAAPQASRATQYVVYEY